VEMDRVDRWIGGSGGSAIKQPDDPFQIYTAAVMRITRRVAIFPVRMPR